ncbi:DUF1566 domain-containing protein [Chromatium okenii]|uniref:Uncharacterized protein n=1 Tax=Chromatium okenii TaxID=61644 RepID=A0A2S7XR38_9GAMM|nr:DUF1566 domain-containing protein [Chromatium okenii]PQJ96214.1 hypothetical protein CXB77_10520 [Chromatium okenii]
MFGIVDHSIAYPGPAIDTNYFPGTPSSWFWSGSPNATARTARGRVFRQWLRLRRRSGQRQPRSPCPRRQSFDTFVDNADGTVTQSNTGLMWAKCSEGQSGTNCTGDAKTMNWSAALTAANNSNLGWL